MVREKNKRVNSLPRPTFSNYSPIEKSANSESLTITATSKVSYTTSPLPSPEEMEKWEKLCPGATDRFIGQWEKQSVHRQKIEGEVITSNISNESRGQILAFIMFMTTLIGGFVSMYFGLTSIGLTAIIGSIVVPAILLIFGKKANIKELLRKREQIENHSPQQKQIPSSSPEQNTENIEKRL
jgi:uncharacterized membrane protein